MPLFSLNPAPAFLLLGPTGVGKSPLGDVISARGLLGHSAHHLDFGAELRSVASRDAGVYSAGELDFIRGVLEQGLLLENDNFSLAEKIIRLFLERNKFSSGHILILNGIPRHVGQAEEMARIADIQAVCVMECSADDVFCRLRNNVGGDRTERVDDDQELVEQKLSIFRERTAPLIHHYERHGSRVYRLSITATTSTDDAYKMLSSLAAAYPPVSLVAKPPQR